MEKIRQEQRVNKVGSLQMMAQPSGCVVISEYVLICLSVMGYITWMFGSRSPGLLGILEVELGSASRVGRRLGQGKVGVSNLRLRFILDVLLSMT